MNFKLSTLGLGLVAIATLSSAPAFAIKGYATDPFGNVVKDPFGNCVRTPYFDPDNIPVECGGVAPVAVVEQPAPTMETRTITLEADTYFDFDEATLKPEGRQVLGELAQEVRQASNVEGIMVVGHTDSIGTEAYNQGLSERRAAAVADYLMQQGVSPSRIDTRGMGEANPIASNATREGRAQNRRVDIEVQAEETMMRQ